MSPGSLKNLSLWCPTRTVHSWPPPLAELDGSDRGSHPDGMIGM